MGIVDNARKVMTASLHFPTESPRGETESEIVQSLNAHQQQVSSRGRNTPVKKNVRLRKQALRSNNSVASGRHARENKGIITGGELPSQNGSPLSTADDNRTTDIPEIRIVEENTQRDRSPSVSYNDTDNPPSPTESDNSIKRFFSETIEKIRSQVSGDEGSDKERNSI